VIRRGRSVTSLMLGVLATLLIAAPPAGAAFGLSDADATFTDSGGTTSLQAGSHPFAWTTTLNANVVGEKLDGGAVKDLILELPPGLVVNPTAVPRCSALDFATLINGLPSCPASTAVGIIGVRGEAANPTDFSHNLGAIYNLDPPPGTAARFGFYVLGVTVIVEGGVRAGGERRLYSVTPNIQEAEPFFGARVTLWGNPADPAHDSQRGKCLIVKGSCSAGASVLPFITLPTSCTGPLTTIFQVDSWQNPGAFTEPLIAETHDDAEPPSPLGTYGCAQLPFHPTIAAQPTAKAAESPTGLDFDLDVKDEGLNNPSGLAASDIKEAEVTLPEGMSVNPSIAEGLAVCSEAQLEAETATSAPGEGCPNASKIGSVEVQTPLLEENVNGALYQATPYENPFHSLIALYIVIKNANRGILVTQAAKVTPNPVTGQLVTTTEDMPQLPFSHFRLHFREGARSPLVTPPGCGSYDVKAVLTPWSGGAPVTTTSAFQIITGPNEGPCPTGGLPPFKPGLVAGTLNNRAGSFSPFNLRLFRSDSEQEITHFSIKLPPGITGKLAGIPYCSDQAIEAAKARTGPHGGQEELDNPSCPAASEIGRTLAGAGVGPSLAYAPGKVYLAGPYHGSNLSMVAITAGVVGPFDIGTVVIREAFKIDPETAEVFVDATGSDPIPHIIRGIPVHLRDIRAYVDRPEFVLNPTDCSPTSTASTVLGSGLDFVSEADDNPVTVTSRFQAADCAALTFAPRLTFRLIGGTKRGKFPKLVSHLQMNGIGESGIGSAQVILPHSEFIENAHFVNICTRVQFKEGAGNGSSCPAGSIYGHARAVTPILSEPLEGPVMLRSNPERKLPDVVAALHNSQVDFDLVGNVDSVKGALRTTFAAAPDAPVTSFDLELEGGSKGLFVNSADLCEKKHFVKVAFGGQNGKQFTTKPLLQVKCKGKGRKHKRHNRRHHRRQAGR